MQEQLEKKSFGNKFLNLLMNNNICTYKSVFEIDLIHTAFLKDIYIKIHFSIKFLETKFKSASDGKELPI